MLGSLGFCVAARPPLNNRDLSTDRKVKIHGAWRGRMIEPNEKVTQGTNHRPSLSTLALIIWLTVSPVHRVHRPHASHGRRRTAKVITASRTTSRGITVKAPIMSAPDGRDRPG